MNARGTFLAVSHIDFQKLSARFNFPGPKWHRESKKSAPGNLSTISVSVSPEFHLQSSTTSGVSILGKPDFWQKSNLLRHSRAIWRLQISKSSPWRPKMVDTARVGKGKRRRVWESGSYRRNFACKTLQNKWVRESPTINDIKLWQMCLKNFSGP